jgi:hypothetical protein
MKLVCPECKSEVPLAAVDLGRDSATCWQCGKDFDCREWIEAELVTPEHLREPPDGATYVESPNGFKVVVSTRAYRWLVLLPAACFWSGLLLIFSWAGLHAEAGWRAVVFAFLTPFYLSGAALWVFALMPVFGKIAIEVDGESGSIFKGIGPFGWRRHFDWSGVKRIRLARYSINDSNWEQIVLEGDNIVQAGRGVRHKRLYYVLIALRLNHRKQPIRC